MGIHPAAALTPSSTIVEPTRTTATAIGSRVFGRRARRHAVYVHDLRVSVAQTNLEWESHEFGLIRAAKTTQVCSAPQGSIFDESSHTWHELLHKCRQPESTFRRGGIARPQTV